MSQQEKEKFKNGMNAKKETIKINNTKTLLDKFEEMKQQEMLAKRKMDLLLEEILLTAMEYNNLEKYKFYFLSVSYYFKRSSTCFIMPCELAMAEFNIAEGLIDTMNIMINPGAIPVGNAYDALNHAKETHGRELPNQNTEGETDYRKIFDKIMEFLQIDLNNIPPIFTGLSADDLEAAELTLSLLAREKGYDSNIFRIYPIEMLLFKLQKKCVYIQKSLNIVPNELLSSIVYAKHCLDVDDFWFTAIGCTWHNDNDIPFRCCFSKVKRWVFTFIKYCIDSRFTLIAGQHFPENYEQVESNYELKSVSSMTDSLHKMNSTKNSWIGSIVSRHRSDKELK